jgi:hypothetical protein
MFLPLIFQQNAQLANMVSTLAQLRQMNKQLDRIDPVVAQPERLKTSGVNETNNIEQSLQANFS